jgi:hypothetical protein
LFTWCLTVNLGVVLVIGNIRIGYTKIVNRRETFASLDLDTKFNLGTIRCESTDWIICLKLRLQFTCIILCKDKSLVYKKKKSLFFPRSEHDNEPLKQQAIYWLSEQQIVVWFTTLSNSARRYVIVFTYFMEQSPS